MKFNLNTIDCRTASWTLITEIALLKAKTFVKAKANKKLSAISKWIDENPNKASTFAASSLIILMQLGLMSSAS